MEQIGIGIIGCGNISKAYFKASETFQILKLISCADINMSAAEAKAEEFGATAQSVEDLLANPDVQLVINLTIPAVHAEVSLQARHAGKHVYCEKPLAVTMEDEKSGRYGC